MTVEVLARAKEGFMRLNVGTSLKVIKEAMFRPLQAYRKMC